MKKTVLITGASGGIGREFAKLHATDGNCKHLILLARTEPKLEALKKELVEANEYLTIDIFAKDLSVSGSADEVYEMTKKRGLKIDVLINNAGFGDYGKFIDGDWKKLEGMMNLNMITLARLTQLYAKDMVEAGYGRVLNVASTAAFVPGPLMTVYYATKAFVLHFSEALDNELEGTGVCVTTLCPGPTASGFQAVAGFGENALYQLKGLPTAAEVAKFGHQTMLCGTAVAIYGFKNRVSVFFTRLLPRPWVVRVIRKLQEERKK